MAEESFYGVTLTGKDSTVEWDVLSNDEDYPRGQKLIIKQILLGAEAKEGEFNVVEGLMNKHVDWIRFSCNGNSRHGM
ncbi:unnamed protein product [Hermetia illucens]|uniref:Nucleoplasmin core domain-containing protein n=1 Tax=Hermetia illucens TaxID=343691 RepID=A0A7R8UQA4_HERIL|nr:unnamed protein product [Hermetia illucens]